MDCFRPDPSWKPDPAMDDERLAAILDADVFNLLHVRADRAGRTVAGQLNYEYLLNRGRVDADPHDTEGRQRARLFQRMRERTLLHG